MTEDNQESLTNKDHELFLDIANDIRTNPSRYREAGKWLNEYCSEDAYWQRQEIKLEELRQKEKDYPVLRNIQNVEQFEEKIKEKRTPAMLVRFQEARDYLLEKYQDQRFIPEEDSRQIIIVTWLLTDPDIKKANVNITEVEQWPWEPIDDATKMSRWYANFLWFHGGKVYSPWMSLVRIAWSKIKGEKELWYQTNTFKFVVIPTACTLILAIPAWFALIRDGQSETTFDSFKDVEEKVEKLKEMATPPKLILMPGIATKNDSEHNRLLWFRPSKNEPLGRITFILKVLDDSSAKIIDFYSDGPSTLERKEISEDGKEAQLSYSLIGWYYPKAVVRTSDACKVVISGSHITEPLTLDID